MNDFKKNMIYKIILMCNESKILIKYPNPNREMNKKFN